MNTINTINAQMLKNMLVLGVANLNKNRDELDSLNIFPVPDGDTGTNMALTSIAAINEVLKLGDNASCDVIMAAFASGSLRGARGNSGVILSQLIRGLAKGLKGKGTIATGDFANALKLSSETAYKAVMKPKEGTVLTVAREMGDAAIEIHKFSKSEDFAEFFEKLSKSARVTLKKTTDMLPALKAANVVDAGGLGLIYIYEGMEKGLTEAITEETLAIFSKAGAPAKAQGGAVAAANADIKFGYCTEFFIDSGVVKDFVINGLKSDLARLGDSIVVVSDDSIVKVHVHTNNPGTVLELALKIGALSSIKIDNMRLQHTSIIENGGGIAEPQSEKYIISADKRNKNIGIIAVSTGVGLNNIFMDLGCDGILEGGQSMNPSADDILSAVLKVDKTDFIILPNNKNIILAAEQAAKILQQEHGKNIRVLATKSLPQGVGAMVAMTHDKPLDTTADDMLEGADAITTGLVTAAVKDSTADGKVIKIGDYMGIIDGVIEIVEKTADDAARAILDKFSEGKELATIYYGDKSQEGAADSLLKYAAELGLEGEVQYGGQAVYDFMIGAE